MRAVEDSKKINNVRTPAIIISASGMATGGRVLHHIARLAPDPGTRFLLAGFQAEGTRGRALEEGAKTLRIYGPGCSGRRGSHQPAAIFRARGTKRIDALAHRVCPRPRGKRISRTASRRLPPRSKPKSNRPFMARGAAAISADRGLERIAPLRTRAKTAISFSTA
jgi:hypothetical protein